MKIDDIIEIHKYLIDKYPNIIFYIGAYDGYDFYIIDNDGNYYARWDRDEIKTVDEIKKIIDSWEE